MQLAVDIGNSNVVIGLWADGEWMHVWRYPSRTDRDSLVFYESHLRTDLFEHRLSLDRVEWVAISSVVPPLNPIIEHAIVRIFEKKPIWIDARLYEELGLSIPNPHEIGSDLVSNAIAAHHRHERPAIIVDFGTALTYTIVDGEMNIHGVAIAPGLGTALRSLSGGTAQLPEVPLELPFSVLGQNTTHAIQAGVLWGYEGMVRAMIGRIRQEVGSDYMAIATGGLSSVLEPLSETFDEVQPTLTLEGIRLMGENRSRLR